MDSLKKKGIILGAHIPEGPSGLKMDRSALEGFRSFSESMLDASDIVRENKESLLRASGNLPWDRCGGGRERGDGGDVGRGRSACIRRRRFSCTAGRSHQTCVGWQHAVLAYTLDIHE